MSQMTATARVSSPARPLRAPKAPARPRLRVVDAAPMPASHMGYGLLCAGLVVVGLLLMLVLNTARAESSFVLSDLRGRSAELAARQVSLQAELVDLRSPQALSVAATKLGMVPSPSTAVLRLSDGVVLGVAAGQSDQGTFTVDLPAPGTEGRVSTESTHGPPAGKAVEDLQAED